MALTTTVEISRQSLQESAVPQATITRVNHLASYSWIEAPIPTISVPGIPPRWSPPGRSRQLPKDSGLIYIAQNAARHPDSPLEPLFRALYTANPSFDISPIDVVTDRNNIRKLLSFVDPSTSQNGLDPFVINVEVTKNTVIFCRTETAATDFIGPHKFRGFGHEFEKAYTTCEISDSTGHHRIVSYRFGGLRFIVRHEVDGYVDSRRGSSSSSKGPGTESLSSLLGSLSLSNAKSTPKGTTPAGSKMVIRQEGRKVPLRSTLEIKTRAAHKPLDISGVAPQLWASQTPMLVRAYHKDGTFTAPKVEDVTAEIKEWEQEKQVSLKKLASLMKKILSVVREYGGSAVIKYDITIDRLVVKKVEGKQMLPKELYSKWDNKHKSEATSAGYRDVKPGHRGGAVEINADEAEQD
ncbi:hypothetical protein F5B20DRAFT_572348 [Whalleya microplaca]|nr:hypothetical protein F5B20DRAFT_572348 [Whalleya microplaca]